MRPRLRRRVHPALIAAAVGLALFAVTFYAFNQGLPFGHGFTVSAIVENSVNVRPGDPVRIAGIDVGAVTAVAPAGEATRISFTVAPDGLPLHRDATVRIRDRLFLEGSYYLELDPGTPEAPPLRDGGTIPPGQTAGPVQFFQVLSTFDLAARADLRTLVAALARGIGPGRGGALASSGAAGLREVSASLKPALTDAAVVTRALRGTEPGDLARLLDSASEVTGTLSASSPQLGALVSGLARTARSLAASDGALGATVSGLDATLRAAPPALRAADAALAPTTRLARALTPSLRVTAPILHGVNDALARLTVALAPARRGPLLSALRLTFVSLPTVLGRFARAFPVTRPVTDCLRTHITPLLSATVPDGALTSGQPVWREFAHFLPGVAGASGDFDANGPYTRVLAAAGDNTLTGGGGAGSGGLLGGTLAGLLGPLVGTAAPGGGTPTAARPLWAGDVTPSDFRPDVPCTSQPLPALASRAGAIRMRVRHTAAPRPLTRRRLAAIARAAAARAAALPAPRSPR
ncbi:MAG TPA: MlaD family protein [Solirubrobacteraceae bacterium]|nr:MlaD family protein [Solirubrobacteraceae bacterium]